MTAGPPRSRSGSTASCSAPRTFSGQRRRQAPRWSRQRSVPDRPVPSCPHRCGHFRPRLQAPRTPAAQTPRRLRLRRWFGPAFDFPIPRSSHESGLSDRPGPASVSTPHASLMLVVPCAAMACAFLPNHRLWTPLYCWTECILWRTAAKLLESLMFSWRGSLENRPDRPKVLWRTVDSGQRFSGEPPDSPRHRPVPGGIRPPGRAATRPVLVPNPSHSRPGHGPASPEYDESCAPDSSRSLPKTLPSSLRQRPLKPKLDARRPIRRPCGP